MSANAETPQWEPKFTIEELRGMNEQDFEAMNVDDLLDARLVADRNNEPDLAMIIFSKMPLAPESLQAAKKTFGAAWIRKHNLNTTRADEKYGSNWLNE